MRKTWLTVVASAILGLFGASVASADVLDDVKK
jgi:hypothetical protein